MNQFLEQISNTERQKLNQSKRIKLALSTTINLKFVTV